MLLDMFNVTFKYMCIVILFILLHVYIAHPKYQTKTWYTIMALLFFNIIYIIIQWFIKYKNGDSIFGISLVLDLLMIVLYGYIIYLYITPFENKDQVDKRGNNRITKYVKTLINILLVLSIVMFILCVLQFIPITATFARPIVMAFT